ncbi:hypothetical protein [Luteibacter sp. UNCMF366Tsu5.1]|uniref:hypothetical protein n=1 Tax=Luteibacter sp. UNCMF366Tsu5.1 TaxID=1502758 RepID=UPI00093023BD|nr:hypothetical protein [Luteibacter sp. UNCMF366Tsu5.1]
MNPREETILAVAEIVRDSAAMNDAALAFDFDEARFRAQLIVGKADAVGLLDISLSAARVLDRLGPLGAVPRSGYGDAMFAVADQLGRIGFAPL